MKCSSRFAHSFMKVTKFKKFDAPVFISNPFKIVYEPLNLFLFQILGLNQLTTDSEPLCILLSSFKVCKTQRGCN